MNMRIVFVAAMALSACAGITKKDDKGLRIPASSENTSVLPDKNCSYCGEFQKDKFAVRVRDAQKIKSLIRKFTREPYVLVNEYIVKGQVLPRVRINELGRSHETMCEIHSQRQRFELTGIHADTDYLVSVDQDRYGFDVWAKVPDSEPDEKNYRVILISFNTEPEGKNAFTIACQRRMNAEKSFTLEEVNEVLSGLIEVHKVQ